MTKADLQEALVVLYLRLNGYFTTGFIVHSRTPGRVTTELDVLAVRLSRNAEPDRGIGSAPELHSWDGGMDFLIGEVKSHGEALHFNRSVRDAVAVATILRWWGHLTDEEILQKTPEVISILEPLPGATAAPTVQCPREARVRAMLFSPETTSERRSQQAWFIPGPPLLRYLFECLHPNEPRAACATNYGAGQWGVGLAPIIAYFKDPNRTTSGSFAEIAANLGI
jgi:hypothetical protein